MAAARNRVLLLTLLLAGGQCLRDVQAVGIREDALLAHAARHRRGVRTEDVEATHVVETVLVERGQGHVVEPRRDQRDLQGIEAVAEDSLVVGQRHLLCATDLDELVEERHAVVPELAVFRRVGESSLPLGDLRPLLQAGRHLELHEEIVERQRVAADIIGRAQGRLQCGERLDGLAAQRVDERERRGRILVDLLAVV